MRVDGGGSSSEASELQRVHEQRDARRGEKRSLSEIMDGENDEHLESDATARGDHGIPLSHFFLR